jgi:hypothetical protein
MRLSPESVMTGDRLSLATRVMRARRQSTCPACHRLIRIGDQIARLVSPRQWIHVACTPAVAAALAAGLLEREQEQA